MYHEEHKCVCFLLYLAYSIEYSQVLAMGLRGKYHSNFRENISLHCKNQIVVLANYIYLVITVA